MNENGLDCGYDNQNISVVICNTYTIMTNHGGDHKSDDFN
jgi:hypothetical protein